MEIMPNSGRLELLTSIYVRIYIAADDIFRSLVCVWWEVKVSQYLG